MRTELEVAQQEARQGRVLAQQRFSHQLLQQQIRNKIEQANQIEDAACRRAELERLREREQAAVRREREIEDEEHEARRQLLVLANAARKREAERVLEWEEELALGRKRELLRAESLQAGETEQKLEAMRRGGATADAIAQHEKLLRTIEADTLHQRHAQQLQVELDERRHALELARAESLGAMDDTAKLALASAPNAALLADFMKTRVQAGMGADQLAALAGVAPLDAARMAQERADQALAQRDAQVDRERRHQLDLLAMQNDVNKAALATQSQLGAGLAAGLAGPGACVHGHPARAGEQFCASCGAPLSS
jgi:hypothetical protein